MENTSITRIGELDYKFELTLLNDNNQVISLNKNAVRSLIITDNIFNPFHEAVLLLSDNLNILERTDINYTFLGNGRDVIFIDLMPRISENDADFDNEQYREHFALSFLFIVTNCTDVRFQNSTCKQLKMVEAAQYLLSEHNSKLQSATVAAQQQGAQATPATPATPTSPTSPSRGALLNGTNAERSVKTGILIKELFKLVYDTGEKTGVENSKIDETSFDEGAENMFVNSTGELTYNDVLNMLYQNHFSAQYKDYCLLNHDRYFKKMSLKSLAEIFKTHDQNVIETIRFQKLVADESAPNGGCSLGTLKWTPKGLPFGEVSTVSQYYADNPDANFTIDFHNNVITNTNIKPNKGMVMSLKSGDVTQILQQYRTLYVDPFNSLMGRSVYPIVKLNNSRVKHNTIDSYSHPEACDLGNAFTTMQKFNALLFMDKVHVFKLKGHTIRKAGVFIDVSNTEDELNTLWDYNTLGRHFITSVQHVFTQDSYMNIVETIKPYTLIQPTA
jgi:hypothetical protein